MMLKQKESVSFTCKKEGSLGRIQIPIGQVSVCKNVRESLWRAKREALPKMLDYVTQRASLLVLYGKRLNIKKAKHI